MARRPNYQDDFLPVTSHPHSGDGHFWQGHFLKAYPLLGLELPPCVYPSLFPRQTTIIGIDGGSAQQWINPPQAYPFVSGYKERDYDRSQYGGRGELKEGAKRKYIVYDWDLTRLGVTLEMDVNEQTCLMIAANHGGWYGSGFGADNPMVPVLQQLLSETSSQYSEGGILSFGPGREGPDTYGWSTGNWPPNGWSGDGMGYDPASDTLLMMCNPYSIVIDAPESVAHNAYHMEWSGAVYIGIQEPGKALIYRKLSSGGHAGKETGDALTTTTQLAVDGGMPCGWLEASCDEIIVYAAGTSEGGVWADADLGVGVPGAFLTEEKLAAA